MDDVADNGGGENGSSGRLRCPACGGDADAGRHFSIDGLGRAHCSANGRIVPSTWIEEHDVEVEEAPTTPLGSTAPAGGEGGPAAVDDGPATAAPLDPLRRVLNQYDLLDHPAGRAAVREQERRGGRLDTEALREILATGDVSAGRRRLCVREYSQLVSPGERGPIGAGGQAPDRGESGGGELVEAVEALGALDRLRSDENDTEEVAEVVASTVSETLGPTLRQVAAAVQDDEADSQLREEVQELRRELREREREQLEETVSELQRRLEAAEAAGGSDLPTDPQVAELEIADRGLERFAEKLPETEELRRLLGDFAMTVSPHQQHAAAAGRVPGSGERFYTPPGERSEDEAGGFNYQPEVRRLDPEQAAGAGSGSSRDRGGDGDDQVAELWDALGGGPTESRFRCNLCGEEFVSKERNPACPNSECGDPTPKPVGPPERGIE